MEWLRKLPGQGVFITLDLLRTGATTLTVAIRARLESGTFQ